MKEKRRSTLLLIVIAIIISCILSMTNPRIGNMEMAALLNLYLPPVVAIFSMLIFLVFTVGFKEFFKRNYRVIASLLVAINLITGIYLHFFYGQ